MNRPLLFDAHDRFQNNANAFLPTPASLIVEMCSSTTCKDPLPGGLVLKTPAVRIRSLPASQPLLGRSGVGLSQRVSK